MERESVPGYNKLFIWLKEQIVNLESTRSVLKILLLAGDFALVNPDEKHPYRNKGNKPFKMIYGVLKEFE